MVENIEYWDLFDINRKIVMKNHIRGNKIPNGLYHLVVHVWIMDDKGNFLFSQRQKGKPDEYLWERTGGSVLMGESSIDGAIREAKEELNIDLSHSTHIFVKSVRRERYHDFFDSWLFIVPSDIEIIPNDEEVMNYKWFNLSELDEMSNKKSIVKSSLYYGEVYELFKNSEIDNTN